MRWMRYNHDFPARTFMRGYSENMETLMARIEEFAEFGKLPKSKGHRLKGAYREIYEFTLTKTRVFGFEYGGDFIITNAARKLDTNKAQEPDYVLANNMRADYINNLDDDAKEQ
jgi:hypothetical protein